MNFVVTSIQGGAGATSAQVVFQTPPSDPTPNQGGNPVPQQISVLNLSVPMTSAGDYVVGEEYDVNITKVAS